MGLFPFLVRAVQQVLVLRVIFPFCNLDLALNYDSAPKLLCTRISIVVERKKAGKSFVSTAMALKRAGQEDKGNVKSI